jgi:elongation factor Tu
MVLPGDNIKYSIELITPIAIEEGCGSRSEMAPQVGAGVVSGIIA